MLQQARTRMLPLVNRAADVAPVTPACCNVCRTCVTTNLVAVLAGGATAAVYGLGRLARRGVKPAR